MFEAEVPEYLLPDFKPRYKAVLYHLKKGTPLHEMPEALGITYHSLGVYLSEMRAIGIDVPKLSELKKLDQAMWGENWFLGEPCERGHIYIHPELGDTGKTLRCKTGNTSRCVDCTNQVYAPKWQKKRFLKKGKQAG